MRRLVPASVALGFALAVGLLAFLAGAHFAPVRPATAQAPIR